MLPAYLNTVTTRIKKLQDGLSRLSGILDSLGRIDTLAANEHLARSIGGWRLHLDTQITLLIRDIDSLILELSDKVQNGNETSKKGEPDCRPSGDDTRRLQPRTGNSKGD